MRKTVAAYLAMTGLWVGNRTAGWGLEWNIAINATIVVVDVIVMGLWVREWVQAWQRQRALR